MNKDRVRATRPPAIEYAPALLDQVRAHVTAGFERTPRGSDESGGVLFGTHSSRAITVTAMRPIPISNLQGPAFVLGPEMEAAFEQIVHLHETDAALAGMHPVGWFLSHARDSLVLRRSDREIFDRYFSEAWQIVLVVRPGLIGSLRAATIGRIATDPQGVVLNSFNIRQLRTAPPHPPSDAVLWLPDSPVVPVKLVPPAEARQRSNGLEPAAVRSLEPMPPRVLEQRPQLHLSPAPVRKALVWQPAVAVSGVLLVVLAGFLYLRAHAMDSIGLQAYQKDGVLRIEWNPASRTVKRASIAKLEILDGDKVTVRDLAREDLERGLWAVLCKRSDCTAKLFLYDGTGYIKEEMARYAGRPVASLPEAPPPPPRPERNVVRRLEREKANLSDALERERARASELDSRVKVLQKILKNRERR